MKSTRHALLLVILLLNSSLLFRLSKSFLFLIYSWWKSMILSLSFIIFSVWSASWSFRWMCCFNWWLFLFLINASSATSSLWCTWSVVQLRSSRLEFSAPCTISRLNTCALTLDISNARPISTRTALRITSKSSCSPSSALFYGLAWSLNTHHCLHFL